MAAPSSKLDYLKRYMSDTQEPREKRKKRKKIINPKATSGIVVVDAEIEVHKNFKTGILEDDPYRDNGPTVAEVVDESIPRGMQDSKKWKSIGKTDGREEESGRSFDQPIFVRRETPDSDISPPRGPRGPGGPQGPRAPRGPQGPRAPRGPQGPRAPRGPQGPRAPRGPQGPRAPRGPRAPQGPRRETGNPKSSSSSTKHSQTRNSSQKRGKSEDSDLSPNREKSDLFQRNPRNSRRSPSDMSPSRPSTSRNKNAVKDSASRRSSSGDLLPVREGTTRSKVKRVSSRDSDLSPVRNATPSQRELSSKLNSTSNQLQNTTLSGMTAGLQSARTLREEADRRRRKEEETFEKMDVEISGRNAETVYRDRKTGKRRDMDAEAVIEGEKAARKKIHDDKFKKWGKGLVQGEKQLQNVNDALHEASKPLTRYADDSDRDALLKAIDRDGDPMLEYVKKRKEKNQGEEGRPRYKGPPPPPNRFAIPPGYRWDGVDRSTGYEKNRFNRISNKTAVSEQAYKWSTEDM